MAQCSDFAVVRLFFHSFSTLTAYLCICESAHTAENKIIMATINSVLYIQWLAMTSIQPRYVHSIKCSHGYL